MARFFVTIKIINIITMKNLLLSGILLATFGVSCSAVKDAQAADKNRTEFLKLKGDWEISSIDYDKNYKVKPFDEGADAQCWVGSQWKLVPNNWTGSYTLNGGGDCPTVIQPIKFEVLNGTQFQFKKIADGTKAKQNEFGYTLGLVSQSENNFTLQDNSSGVTITYNFQKVSQ